MANRQPWLRRSDAGRQIRRDLVISIFSGLVVGIILFPVSAVIQLLPVIIPLQSIATQISVSVVQNAIKIVLIAGVVSLLVYYYAQWTSRIPNVQEVTRPLREVETFTFVQKLLLVPIFRSRVRIALGACIVISVILHILISDNIPTLELFIIYIILAIHSLREIQTGYEGIREVTNNVVLQLLFTLGKHVETALSPKYNTDGNLRIRCHIMMLDAETNKLTLCYCYRMQGDTDMELEISPNQCIRGRALDSRKPECTHYYKPAELNFSRDQQSIIPENIQWMIAYPLYVSPDEPPIGVLGIDGNKEISDKWMNKLLGYGQAMAAAISVNLRTFI